ncbi:Transcriptional activator somA [Colletotrichum sp. SAR11_240]|nr:Transcriptional activator somA [Colletotrichum sp. SAR11_240]
MNVNVNPNMANMNAMGGPVGAPVPMMNNGAVAPQVAGPRQMPVPTESQRTLLNTYIYEYFLRHQMFDCARSLVNGDHQINVTKDGANRRRDENGNLLGNGLGDDPMDTDSKDDIDAKLPDDLPAPKLPMPASESSFLYEWFCLFWDIFNAQRTKGGNGPVNQYVSHTQQQSRMRQNQQQELLRQMRPEGLAAQQQYHNQMMRNMQNGGMAMNMKQGNLARTAMANNQNNPQAMQMLQHKQTQMQRDPSDMEGNRQRPSSPGSGENAPSPSKRPRLDGTPYNPSQPGMMPNGRPQQGMPGQQVGTAPNVAQAQQMLITNGINPAQLTQQQFTTFSNQPPAVQAKSIATYAANLQQHQASQMPNKPMPNTAGPQGQGSPMMAQGPDQAGLAAYYNAGEMPAGIRPGPGGAQAGGGSNHALQDYQMQLMLLEQQNKKRLMMARQEQDSMGGAMPRGDGPAGPGGPGAPPGPNGQPFPETSPQGARTGASPNPTEQMKRGTPQMNNAGIPSPLPEGAQSRGSPNPMNFMGNQMDPNMAPHFFKGMANMDGNMVPNPQINGMRPPSSHPGQTFNGQMNPQQMMAARQQQQQQAAQQQQQQQGQPPQQQQQQPQQGGQGNQPVQWQGGPNGNQMVPQGPQGQVQGTPQQRSMPPPSAPAAANANRTNTSSPQQATAAPPTPSQANKAAPKKKDNKNAKAKAATQKKSNPNLNSGATPAADGTQDQEPPTPATPITPVNPASFKAGQNAPVSAVPNGQPPAPAAAPAPQVAPQAHSDANQNGSFGMDSTNGMVDFGAMAFADPLVSDNVLNDFDFDSFLHEDGDNQAFDFNTGSFGMEGANEIGAD